MSKALAHKHSLHNSEYISHFTITVPYGIINILCEAIKYVALAAKYVAKEMVPGNSKQLCDWLGGNCARGQTKAPLKVC